MNNRWNKAPKDYDTTHSMTFVDPHEMFEAWVKWDGCVELREVKSPIDMDPADKMHICSLDDMIERLTDLRDNAKAHFGEKWPS